MHSPAECTWVWFGMSLPLKQLAMLERIVSTLGLVCTMPSRFPTSDRCQMAAPAMFFGCAASALQNDVTLHGLAAKDGAAGLWSWLSAHLDDAY
jgi:hypothetical protein